MFRRRALNAEIPEKVHRRVSKMTQEDIVAWSDQALYAAGRSLTAYLRDPQDVFLKDAHTAAQVLLAATTELDRRRG
jgi:hypothetical protein